MFYSYAERKYIIETPAEPITVNYITETGRGTITLNAANVFPCTVHDIKTIIDILWKSSDSYGIAEKIAEYLRACVAEIQETREKYNGPADAKYKTQLSGMIKKYISNLDKIADAFGFSSLSDCEVDNMKMSKCEVLCNENDTANTNETGRKITTYAGKTFTKGGIIFQVHQKRKKGARYITIPGTGSYCTSYCGPEKEAPSHITDDMIESLKKCAENGKIQETRADFVKVCNACGITPDDLQDIFTQAPQETAPETVTECTQETTPETVPAIDINAFIEDCEKSENYYYNAETTTQNADYKRLLDYGEKIITYSAPIPGLTEKQTRAFIRLLISARGDYFTSDREIVSFAENVIYYFAPSTEKKPQTVKKARAARPDHNAIKRNTKYIVARSLVDTNAGKAGEVVKIYHDDFTGWIQEHENGARFACFIQHIRNAAYYEILSQSETIPAGVAPFTMGNTETSEETRATVSAGRPQNGNRITADKRPALRPPYYIIAGADRRHGAQVWKPCTMTAGGDYDKMYMDICAHGGTGSPQENNAVKHPKNGFTIQGYINLYRINKNPATGTETRHNGTIKLTAYAHGAPPGYTQKHGVFYKSVNSHTAERRKARQKSPPEFLKRCPEIAQVLTKNRPKTALRFLQGVPGSKSYTPELYGKNFFKKKL